MTTNLLEHAVAPDDGDRAAEAGPPPPPPAGPAGTAPPGRPGDVPEKFWDADKGELRADALIKSYGELERKLGAMDGDGVPEDAEDYAIVPANEHVASDPDVNARLHAAGFNRAQAQLVYDLAAERLTPMIEKIAGDFQNNAEVDRLVRHFGDAEKWHQTSRQLAAWGKAKLPPDMFTALSTTYDGILAMQQMMKEAEPRLGPGGETGGGGSNETVLKDLMKDPRYWRDNDPVIVEKVRQGFSELYPDEG